MREAILTSDTVLSQTVGNRTNKTQHVTDEDTKQRGSVCYNTDRTVLRPPVSATFVLHGCRLPKVTRSRVCGASAHSRRRRCDCAGSRFPSARPVTEVGQGGRGRGGWSRRAHTCGSCRRLCLPARVESGLARWAVNICRAGFNSRFSAFFFFYSIEVLNG